MTRGGTFVSIIEMGDGQEVLATAGNNKLGGDPTRELSTGLCEFKKAEGIDLTNVKWLCKDLRAAEKQD